MNCKSIIYTLLFSVITFPLSAQITLTNSYFPVAGDSFRIATATTATTKLVRLTPSGGNQTWNYNFLRSARNSTTFSTERYRVIASDTSALRQYPDAELVRQTDSGQVAALNRTTTKLELLGYKDFNLGNFNVSGVTFRYSPPVNERHAPLIYNAPAISLVSNFSAAVPSSAIPDSILSRLPIRPDSVRINYRIARQDKNDAWGTVLIPGAASVVSVLRERRFEESEVRVEVKISIFPWVDITPTLVSAAGFRPQKDTTISYYFWSNTTKQPLVVINTNAQDSVLSVDYKWQQITANVQNTEGVLEGVPMSVYPNPSRANSESFLEIKDLKSSNYTVSAFTIDGKILLKKDFKNGVSDRIFMKLIPLPVGLYFIELTADKPQNGVKTMRLVVVE